MLTYHCGPGRYAFPVSYRLCSADGEWSLMRLANGRQVSRATCKGNVLEFSLKASLCAFILPFFPASSAPHPPPSSLSVHLSLPDVLCPAQLQLDHGDFWPREQWFRAGMTQSFSCQEGFTLYGSAERNCTLSGDWTGTTPVCDNHGEDGQHYQPYA